MEDKKCRICRSAGEKLFLKGEKCFTPKCPITRRNYPPGIHGESYRRKMSEYGVRLKEKQKARAMYGVKERQFANYYQRAVRSAGDSSVKLVQFLESRLDNVVFRMGLATSRGQARQLVGHGHIAVNGRRVDIPSYQLRTGETVSVVAHARKLAYFADSAKQMAKVKAPSWLALDSNELTARVSGLPDVESIKANFDTNLIIEYYAR